MVDEEITRALDRVQLSVRDSLRTEKEQALFSTVMGDVTEEEVKRLQEIVFLRKPVDIATFVTHKDYLGKADFWPMWLKDLETFFGTEHYLGILRGSIGCGKTTFADVAIAYMTYQLSCLKDPAAAYGLLSGSTVALICVSVNMTQAKRVLFKRLKAMLEGSPYFREHFPANWQVQSELRFPKAVWVAPVASNEQNVIGENVFGGVVDEGNFMPVIEESKRAKSRGGVYDRAQVLFDALRRRMKSRFPGMPGRFMLISSEQYPDDFIDRTCRQYKDDPGVLIRQYTVWEPRPKTFYCGETFSLEIGTEVRPTRILTGSETDIVGEVMHDVPCLDGDTAIPLLDGTTVPIRDLAARDLSEPTWVYSINVETKAIRPGRVTRAWKSGVSWAMVRVWLDNGKSVRCTRDHPFLLRGGSYREAAALQPGDRLMPLYRQLDERGYEQVYVPAIDAYRYTHRVMAGPIPRRLRNAKGQFQKGLVVHHATFRKRDNRPETLEWMNGEEHRAVHRGTVARLWRENREYMHKRVAMNPRKFQAMRESAAVKAAAKERGRRRAKWYRDHPEARARLSESQRNSYRRGRRAADGFVRYVRSEAHATYVRNRWKHDPEFRRKVLAGAEKYSQRPDVKARRSAHLTAYNKSDAHRRAARLSGKRTGPRNLADWLKTPDGRAHASERARLLCEWINYRKTHGLSTVELPFAQFKAAYLGTAQNHRVVKVEADGVADVYDLTVQRWNNVALDAGVFVHNCEYRKEFEDDPDGATRDIAGRSTLALTPFITDRQSIRDAIDTTRQHPMTDTVTTLRDGVAFAWERLCTRLPDGSWAPRFHPERLRYIHIDLGLSHDWAGLAMGCCAGTTEVERTAEAGIEVPNLDGLAFAVTKERVPLVWYDFLLSVKAPPFEQIMFGDIRTVIYELVNHGFRIQKVSFDSFGSISEIQTLQQKGYDVEKLSVDTSMDPYLFLRTALHERRLKYYEHPVLLKELVQLEHHKAKKKVDHPPSGCFAGDTRIALANGTCPTFAELVTMPGPFFVYTIGTEGVEIAEATHPRVTRHATELVEVMLDNFQVVRCTPEHLFMTLDREWVQAANLTPDIRIMPLYRSVELKGGYAGYERLWCPVRKKRVLTHRLAVGLPAADLSVHHEDENRLNNFPTNLRVMTRQEHLRLHGLHAWPYKERMMRDGHAEYRELDNGETSRFVMLQNWAEGKFGEKRQPCAVEGCDRLSNARGLCDMHYQRARRAKKLPERVSKQQNHRVLSVQRVIADEDVYDLSVPGFENFALAAGVFVHNSKDLTDGAAGVAYWVHLLGMTDPPVIELGLTENAPSHKIDARDDCKAKDCTKKAEVRGYCRAHWDALEPTKQEKLIEDRSDVIWELPGMTDGF